MRLHKLRLLDVIPQPFNAQIHFMSMVNLKNAVVKLTYGDFFFLHFLYQGYLRIISVYHACGSMYSLTFRLL